MDKDEVFDERELLEEIDGDTDLLRKLLEVFTRDCDDRLERIRSAAERGEMGTIANEAHALKGGVGNFFANRSREMAEDLERLAKEGATGGLEPAVAGLERELRLLREAVAETISG